MRNLFAYRTIVVLFALYFTAELKGQEQPLPRKNIVEVEFLGNGYYSPFIHRYTRFTLNYKRVVSPGNALLQLSVGVGIYETWWLEDNGGHGGIVHKPWALSLPIGASIKLSHRPNGFWLGTYFITGFGKQTYYYIGGTPQHTIKETREHHSQISPNVSYQFQAAKQHVVVRISWTPKISLGIPKESHADIVYPLWGGISIGGAW